MFKYMPSNYSFSARWPMIALTCLAITLFVGLGFWQLERAAEKKQMIERVNELTQQSPVDWVESGALPKQYQAIRVQGHFLPDMLLLDNQFYQHELGYDIVSPFVLKSGQVILVDRGWVIADKTRRTLPRVTTSFNEMTLTGMAYYPSKKTWLLGPAIEKKSNTTAVVELLDTQLISQFLHKSVYPFIIRLGKHEAGGYIRQWAVVAMPPERHYGYALQWFAIAFVILILFIVLNISKTS